MFKNKTFVTALLAVMVLALIAPMMISAMDSISSTRSGYWTCASIPLSYCRHTTSKACSGDVWWHYGCYMYCKAGNTTTPRIDCRNIILDEPHDDVRSDL
ncbi:MAG: hypothetical protein GY765_28550 [bacterium]|nr:hypothetical protein [bacterium]